MAIILIFLFIFGSLYSAASIFGGMMMSDREAAKERIRRGAHVGFWLILIGTIVLYWSI